MIKLREYNVKDWSQIEDAIEPFIPPVPAEDFLEMTKRGVAVTGIENDKIMACGGISYMDDENGIAWAKVSKKCLRNSSAWAAVILETFTMMSDSVNLKVSTYVLDNFCRGERLAKLIGLQKTDESKEHNGNLYHKFTS